MTSERDLLDLLERNRASTREIAASLMRASTPGHTPDPDDGPDQPDALTATVASYLRRKDNKGRAHFGLLPNQEEE